MLLKFHFLLRIVFEFDMAIILSITVRFMFHYMYKDKLGCYSLFIYTKVSIYYKKYSNLNDLEFDYNLFYLSKRHKRKGIDLTQNILSFFITWQSHGDG